MNIDIHNHFIPDYFLKKVRKGSSLLNAEIIDKNGQTFISHKDKGIMYPCHREFYDMETKLEYMEEKDIDLSIISVAPPLFYYWTDPEVSLYVAQLVNDEAHDLVKSYPGKLEAMATVPMNDVEASVKELERAVKVLGMKSVEIGANIEGQLLNDPKFFPFFKKAEELDVLVFVHPLYTESPKNLQSYYLANFIGNPYETTVTIANLIFSGFIDIFPKLKLCFSHGGGFFPYQIGRFEHGYNVRDEANKDSKKSPLELLDRLYFDTLTFNPQSLNYLIQLMGSKNILMGSDAPFQMSETNPVSIITGLDITQNEKDDILSKNAMDLFGINN